MIPSKAKLNGIFLLRMLGILLMLSFASTVKAQQPFLEVPIKLKIDDGNVDNASIVIQKNGTVVKTLTDLRKAKLELDFNTDYLITFSKPGYISKKISFSTKVPAERLKEGFDPFPFICELFKQYDGVNTVIFNQPVGKIGFSTKVDEFDYDVDYTKSIQSALAVVEKEIAAKVVEEKAKTLEANKSKSAEDTKKLAEAQAAEKAKADADAKTTAAKKAEAEASSKAKAASETKAKAEEYQKNASKARADDEAKKLAKAKADEDARLLARAKADEDAKKSAAQKADEEAKRSAKAKGMADEDAKNKAKAKADEEAKNAANTKNKEEYLASTAAKAKADEEARNAAKQKIDEEYRAATLAKAKADEEARKNSQLSADEYKQKIANTKAKLEEEERERARLRSENDAKITAAIAKAKMDYEEELAAKAKAKQKETLNAEAPKVFEEGITSEVIEEEGYRTINKVTVKKGGKVIVYNKIQYKWGGLFYFMDAASITEPIFELYTRKE